MKLVFCLLVLCTIGVTLHGLPSALNSASQPPISGDRGQVSQNSPDEEYVASGSRTKRSDLAADIKAIIAFQKWLIIGFFSLILMFTAGFFVQLRILTDSRNQIQVMNSEIVRKNTELEAAYHEMELIARKDPLTKLSNRRDMVDRLEYERSRALRSNKPFVIAMVDIDFFKRVNDTHGHDAGDFILEQVAHLMIETVRRQDIVARWGGEEFLLLLPETELAGGEIATEKVREGVEKHAFAYHSELIQITVTIGYTEFNGKVEMDDCIKNADIALYQGKTNGRNQVRAFANAKLPELNIPNC
jgi:diguanylate cyclase (GGDEF)-like protein